MSRYQSQFYEPLVADWSNYGTWSEKRRQDSQRTRHRHLARDRGKPHSAPQPPTPDRLEALDTYIARRTKRGRHRAGQLRTA